VLDNISDQHKVFVIDFSAVPFLDSTAANTIEGICRKAKRSDLKIFITGTTPAIRRTLFAHGVKPPAVTYKHTINVAVASFRSK
jgi:SulP family sulfate permease